MSAVCNALHDRGYKSGAAGLPKPASKKGIIQGMLP